MYQHTARTGYAVNNDQGNRGLLLRYATVALPADVGVEYHVCEDIAGSVVGDGIDGSSDDDSVFSASEWRLLKPVINCNHGITTKQR